MYNANVGLTHVWVTLFLAPSTCHSVLFNQFTGTRGFFQGLLLLFYQNEIGSLPKKLLKQAVF